MTTKKKSDISFLPAFLVPSTVIKFLLRLASSGAPAEVQELPWKKSANPFIFSLNHTQFSYHYFWCCTVAGLFFKKKSELLYLHLKKEKSFINYFAVWDCCMILFCSVWTEFIILMICLVVVVFIDFLFFFIIILKISFFILKSAALFLVLQNVLIDEYYVKIILKKVNISSLFYFS